NKKDRAWRKIFYGFPLILANIYASNWDDHRFFTNVFARLPNMSSHNIIFEGDLNCSLSAMDHSSHKSTLSPNSACVIQSFLDHYGLADVWRFHNPASHQYSFFSNVHKTYICIEKQHHP
uniref:Endonuclease/exonuclease/phosphatase domain-containing protein n=1 Tax=Maylandia zebra TaxID=106582 RepID=A0A3P9DHN7_9CICH